MIKNSKNALCIGINDYPGTGSDLSGCVNDANDWADVLKGRGFTVQRILNKDATGEVMRSSIRELIRAAKKGDSVIITYSGHGSFVPDLDGDEPDGTDECLCPHDISSNGPITDDDLFELYSAGQRGVKTVMISDSCHSGSVTRFAPISTPPTTRSKDAPQRKVRFLPPETYLSKREFAKLGKRRARRVSSPPGRYAALLLAGCQDTEYSYDAWFEGRANGAFSFVALSALSSLKENATYGDWFNAIRAKLPSQQYPQTPNLYGSRQMKRWRVLQ
ncbi:MAG: caspase family protein [Candidatus Abyssobacteria bacterium SURF_5]|uniref:Caspase family protein n=1 Tax=Abyssobacteria bacterium (strain SURF_5) TaxID=2093360 RepID=A0A3A4NEB4_ABYX5|nr:MAG: caspase family protein [Candidatus Abyssubacteria bacterium SURF_5]